MYASHRRGGNFIFVDGRTEKFVRKEWDVVWWGLESAEGARNFSPILGRL